MNGPIEETSSVTIRAQNLLALQQLKKLHQSFEAEQIMYLTWKGVALIANCYSDDELRITTDLDIVIDKSSLAKVVVMFERLDYHLVEPFASISLEKLVRLGLRQFSFEHGSNGQNLDLHLDFFPAYFAIDLSFEEVCSRAVIVDGLYREPSLEDHLFLLSVHGCKHHWSHEKWSRDIHFYLKEHREIDVERVLRRAQEIGCLRMLLVALAVAKERHGTELGKFTKNLDALPSSLAFIYSQKPRVRFLFLWSEMRKLMFYRDSFLAKISVLRLVMEPKVGELLRWNLPTFFFPLYWLLRPLNLLFPQR